MAFKENILKKMEINRMANKVLASFKPLDGYLKLDKETMREIFKVSPYIRATERDLELYIQDTDTEKKKIVVLDNELPIYITSIDDVVLRKSPTIKEMVNIRNAIKIISDKDVKISRKEEALRTIQAECIALIDLTFNMADLEEIENEGVGSLERSYTDGVIESISIFAELLEYIDAPKPFKINHCKIFGALSKKQTPDMLFGPVVIYNMMHNTLKLIDQQISNSKEFEIKFLHGVAFGKETADKEDASVLKHLKNEISKRYL